MSDSECSLLGEPLGEPLWGEGYDTSSDMELGSDTDTMAAEPREEKMKAKEDEESDDDDPDVILGPNTPFPPQQDGDSVQPVPEVNQGVWDFRECTCPSDCSCTSSQTCVRKYLMSDGKLPDGFDDFYQLLYGVGYHGPPIPGFEEHDYDRDVIEEKVIECKLALYPALQQVYKDMGRVLHTQPYNVTTPYAATELLHHDMHTFVHAWFIRELCVWAIKELRRSGLMEQWTKLCSTH